MKTTIKTFYVSAFCAALSLAGCGSSGGGGSSGSGDVSSGGAAVLPMFVDENNNSINDYVELSTHSSASQLSAGVVEGAGLYGHEFLDTDKDGICDYAQNCSNTWHGPGFVDSDNDGICDYWDIGHPNHNRHEGIHFQDQNHNQINDYCEHEWHGGYGHDFVDNNLDGICDHAQYGSNAWHGPGYIDENTDGICDHWQSGGRGHGHHN